MRPRPQKRFPFGRPRSKPLTATSGADPIAGLSIDALLFAIGAGAGAATLLGGLLTLRARGRVPLILGFSAGAVMGVALFDLLPEALELGGRIAQPGVILGMTGVGFCGFMILERSLKAIAEERGGHLAPASLTFHSLLDGLGVGLAFQASPAIGVVAAAAVLAHDLADGVNTVTLSFSGGGGAKRARGWLIADAAAPLVGVGLTRLFSIGAGPLGLVIALFAGFFLYIGASELTPASHRALPRLWTSLATLAGMAAIWVVVRLAAG